jgi:twitching motility protein PilT
MAKIDAFLIRLIQMGGSDLIIASSSPPIIRLHGELTPINMPPFATEDVEELLWEMLTEDQKKDMSANLDLDFAYEIKRDNESLHRFRANAYFQKGGLNIVLRVIPKMPPLLTDLGFPLTLARITEFRQGMVLVTGPSSCGKTTTLAALINCINEQKALHIVTIEDPIEYLHPRKRALINQRQVGIHVESFQMALRAVLREDPDIIMVGELRDFETIQMAITAAETGHLVMGTLHTNSAAKTVERLINIFPAEQQPQIRVMLADSLRGIISQQLVPRADRKGRVVAFEVLYSNPAVSTMIREGRTYQISSVMQTGRHLGMQMMDACLLELIRRNIITFQDALDYCQDKKLLIDQYRGN